MKIGTVLLCCSLGCLAGLGATAVLGDDAVFSSTPIQGPIPAGTAHILNYRLDKATPGSGDETGNLHIVYSDGTEVVCRMALKTTAPATDATVFNQVGIDDIKVAADRRTLGWEEMSDNCCTSYAIPVSLAIYRAGGSILHIRQGQMIWYWAFRDGGRRVAVVWGATHGPEVGDYQLIDVGSGRLIAEAYGDGKIQALDADAPPWARRTEQAMHRQ